MKTFNEKLASWIHATPATEAGINNIQVPGQSELLVWQTLNRTGFVGESIF